jgi:hypothetical protein
MHSGSSDGGRGGESGKRRWEREEERERAKRRFGVKESGKKTKRVRDE